MTKKIISVGPDEKALQAVNLFTEHGYGRLPVIDPNGFLVGIITKGDITRGLVSALNKGFQGEEIKKYRASHIFEDTSSDSTSLLLRYYVAPKDFEEGGKASSTLKRMFERLGVDPDLLKRITISAYEAEMNLIIHTNNGGEIRVEISPERIVLITEDKGPGIEDVEEALKPGYSTAPDWVRGLGFGAGMGLCNIKRYSDEISLVSESGKGTVLTAIFEVKPKAQAEQDPEKST
jgi:anti-sigma regulatory factor (Ser/Thr protein kinase)